MYEKEGERREKRYTCTHTYIITNTITHPHTYNPHTFIHTNTHPTHKYK